MVQSNLGSPYLVCVSAVVQFLLKQFDFDFILFQVMIINIRQRKIAIKINWFEIEQLIYFTKYCQQHSSLFLLKT